MNVFAFAVVVIPDSALGSVADETDLAETADSAKSVCRLRSALEAFVPSMGGAVLLLTVFVSFLLESFA